MTDLSDYLENALLNHVFRNTGLTSPTTVYVSAHTADPGEDGSNEVSGGSYARLAGAFGAPSGGQIALSSALNFTSMPAATITHVGVWDASSAGNFLMKAALSASKVVGSGDTFSLTSLTLTLA